MHPAQLQREGADPKGDAPERFNAHFEFDIAKWEKIMREARIEAY